MDSSSVRLTCITDIHGKETRLESILAHAPSCDAILLGGDLTNFGQPDDAARLVRLAQSSNKNVIAVAGNCDSPEIDTLLHSMGVSAFRRVQSVGPLSIYGVSAMPPWRGDMYELTEEEIADSLRAGATSIDAPEKQHDVSSEIVLSHPPPSQTSVDQTHSGVSAGSSSVRAFLESRQPLLCVCGHIHEARGIDSIGHTRIINCGPAFVGHYAQVVVSRQEDGEADRGFSVEVEMLTAPRR